MTAQSWLKIIASVVMATATALTPFYGKDAWFIGIVAAGGALSLAAQSVFGSLSKPPPKS